MTNFQDQSFVGTPLLKYVTPRDEEFCRMLNRVVNGEGFDGTWKYGAVDGTADLFNRHEQPDVSIALFEAASQTITVSIADTTPELRSQISDLCDRYGITYAEA